jgi:hypothetical protein
MLEEIDALLAVNDQVTAGYEIPHDLNSMMEIVFGGEYQPGRAQAAMILEDARYAREIRAARRAAGLTRVDAMRAVNDGLSQLGPAANGAGRSMAEFLQAAMETIDRLAEVEGIPEDISEGWIDNWTCWSTAEQITEHGIFPAGVIRAEPNPACPLPEPIGRVDEPYSSDTYNSYWSMR